jgi:hypothetical protein
MNPVKSVIYQSGGTENWKVCDSTTAVGRKQRYGHVSLAKREHAIMEGTFSVRSVPGLYDED